MRSWPLRQSGDAGPFRLPLWCPSTGGSSSRAGWWDVVDELACRVGDALLAEPEKVAPILRTWAKSPELWLRRAAIVCQRKARAKTDVDLLFACIGPSLGEKDFFLRKGIGWALRALAYHAPDEVLRYVRLHADELSPLSQREALRRLAREGASMTARPPR